MKAFSGSNFLRVTGALSLCLFIFMSCSISTVKSPKPTTVDYCNSRTIYVRTDKGVRGGSGVVLRNHVVLTAYHVVRNHPTVLIERYTSRGKKIFSSTAHVVHVNKKYDLALLNTEKNLGVSTRIAGWAVLGESVYTFGYPYDRLSKKRVYFSYSSGRVNTITNKHIRFDSSVYFGSSGGPIFNKKGEVLSIVQLGYSGIPAFYGARPKIIRKFLEKANSKVNW